MHCGIEVAQQHRFDIAAACIIEQIKL